MTEANAPARSLPRAVAHRLVWGLGLQDVLFRLREHRSSWGGAAHAVAPGEPPLPPALLRARVFGYPDPQLFLDTGRRIVAEFDGAFAPWGPGLAEAKGVLDLGCGCGRLARWFPGDAAAALTGMDLDARAIEWCAGHLPGRWRVNRLGQPLPAADGAFEIVYACSVVTHLRRETARAWLAEVARVLKPGGRALVTYHDPDHPTAAPARAALLRDGYAVRTDRLEGTNFMAAYVTTEALRDLAAPGLELLAATPSAGSACGQAIAVFRRR